MNKSLKSIFKDINESGGTTDKDTLHSYVDVYEGLFSEFRKTIRNGSILEIGIRDGSSLEAWDRYFGDWQVWGIDNFSETGKAPDIQFSNRVHVCKVDTCKFPKVLDFNEIMSVGLLERFDIIIDDGLHHPYSQVANFAHYTTFLVPGGLYVVEDVEDISFANKMKELFGGIVIDRREVKKRHDDILWVWRCP